METTRETLEALIGTFKIRVSQLEEQEKFFMSDKVTEKRRKTKLSEVREQLAHWRKKLIECEGELAIKIATERYGYTDELKTALKRVIPVMADGKSEEARNLLYQTLISVPIYVIDSERPTEEDLRGMRLKTFEREELILQDMARGEYNTSGTAAGAYEYDVQVDENGRPKGIQGFVYVSRLSESQKQLAEVYGTTINLSHLIHELGHAWGAMENNFTQLANNTYSYNIGTNRETIIQDEQTGEIKIVAYEGLILEEILNTILEEDTLIKLLGIENIDELNGKGYIKSRYQGPETSIGRRVIGKFGASILDGYRFLKDKNARSFLNEKLRNTEAFMQMRTPEYPYEKRNKLMDLINQLETTEGDKGAIAEFLEKNSQLYYANNAATTPLGKLDNVLNQMFSFERIKTCFNLAKVEYDMKEKKVVTTQNKHNGNIYSDFMMTIINEAMGMINEAQVEKEEKGTALEEH